MAGASAHPSEPPSPPLPGGASGVRGATRLTERYEICEKLASGGMATVHLGRLVGPVAFARTVAIKRLHPQFASDPDFRLMLTDEARLAARIHHPNVVQVLDVVATDGELFLVMQYVDGISLRRLMIKSAGHRVSEPILASVMCQLLHGLHAAHEAIDEHGAPLGIVHRDVSPDNVLVGADGLARVLDFGIAKATSRLASTRDGQIKGKLAYMAPEQLAGRATRQSDVFAASIIFWEGLVGRRLFQADDDAETIGRVLACVVEPPASLVAGVDPRLSAIAMRGLARNPEERWATAREMALAIERDAPLATASQIGAWVESVGGASLVEQRARVQRIEASAAPSSPAGGADARVPTATVAEPFEATAATLPAGVRERRRRRDLRVAFGLSGMVASTALIAWLARPRIHAVAPPAAASLAPSTGEPAAAPTLPSTTTAASADAPATSVSARADGPAVPSSKHVAGAKPARPAHASVHRAPQACNPPYRIGPMGEKVWLKECL